MGLLLAILLGALVGLSGSTFLYGKGMSYFSNDPRSCKNCHIMNDQYDSWLKSSHHAAATCNDCHAPHALLPKLMSKADNGFWHSKGFTLQDFPEPIRIRERNRQVLNRNCLECHHGMVEDVVAAHASDVTRFDCIRCHVASGHGPER
ncbi:MAG: cytochrome c nitrite reductase small subunit [Krumholzibacteria bacterium]|nr:cytochrome c nitrite reductase small subunit [Candidatus Krumholzibacteria bacterium]